MFFWKAAFFNTIIATYVVTCCTKKCLLLQPFFNLGESDVDLVIDVQEDHKKKVSCVFPPLKKC